jgi:glycosyltransferase involved in cell wall biosynthesis
MNRKKVVIVIAAYNEERKIKEVLKEVSQYAYKVVVVNDGSTDKTASQIKGKKIVLLNHIINLGQGAALQTGFEYAKTLKPDVVITYDADGQFAAKDITKFILPIINKKCDVVLGSRFLGKAINMPLSRYIVLRLGVFFTYLFSSIQLTDTHNGFRAFSGQAIEKIDLTHNRWAHPSEIIYQISKYKFKVLEVPITVKYTKYSWKKGQKNFEALKIPVELILKALVN